MLRFTRNYTISQITAYSCIYFTNQEADRKHSSDLVIPPKKLHTPGCFTGFYTLELLARSTQMSAAQAVRFAQMLTDVEGRQKKSWFMIRDFGEELISKDTLKFKDSFYILSQLFRILECSRSTQYNLS